MKDFAPYWLDDDLLNNYVFGFPQSSQVFGCNTYCWDDMDISVKEITTMFNEFKEKFNSKEDIIAGASQGGRLAIELVLNDIIASKGFIAVIPSIQNVAAFENLINENKKVIKGYIITGDKDSFYNNVVELVKIFEKNNYQCRLIVKEGLGHFFPKDFTDLLKEAIEFVIS